METLLYRRRMAMTARQQKVSGEKCLRATGNAYIDTGISQLDVGAFEVKFCPVNLATRNNAVWEKICGGRSSHNQSNALSCYYNVSNRQVGAAIGGRYVDAAFSNILPDEWHTFKWDYSTGQVSLDGNVASQTFPSPTGNSYPFYLFATGGQEGQEFPGSIAYCTIWNKSGEKIWDGTPYKSGTTVGMFDKVSNTVFTSPVGLMLRGEVEPANGLKYFDYLIGDGFSYIDTLLDVSGNPFNISGSFVRLRDASFEDTIMSNFARGPGYWSIFIAANQSQKINMWLDRMNLLGDNAPTIGQEVALDFSWSDGVYNLSGLGASVSGAQENSNNRTVRLLARGEDIGQYPCPVLALKGEWFMNVNGTVVRRLKPCSYNGVAGMHDIINNVFYPNAYTGTYTGSFVLDND